MRAIYALAFVAAGVTVGCAIAALVVAPERLGAVLAIAVVAATVVILAAVVVVGVTIVWPRVSALEEPPRTAVRQWLRGVK